MSHLAIPFYQLQGFCFLDALTTPLLLWSASAVIGFVKRFNRGMFHLSLSLSLGVTLDHLAIGWRIWQSPWTAGILTLALALVLVRLRLRLTAGSSAKGIPIGIIVFVVGWVAVVAIIVGLGYAGWRGLGESVPYFSRLACGTLALIVVFAALNEWPAPSLRVSLSIIILTLITVIFGARIVSWNMIWSAAGKGSLPAERMDEATRMRFRRIGVLLEVRLGLGIAEEDLPGAVEHLRNAARLLDSEWWRRDLESWTEVPVGFLLTVSFGGSVQLDRDERAAEFLLDEVNRRFLVLTDRGRIISTGPEDALLADVGFAPVGFCFVRDRVLAVLGQGGEFAVVSTLSGEAKRRELGPGEYRALDCAGGTVFVLRSDGSVLRLGDGVPEEFLPAIWKNRAPAVDIALTEDGSGTYVLDVHGGIHPRGNTPIEYSDLRKHDTTIHYWPRGETAVAIQLTSGNFPVYADRYGGIHGVGKDNGELLYSGHERPVIDEAAAVDLIVAENLSAVYVLTRRGRILMVPNYGWLDFSASIPLSVEEG